MRFIGPAAIHSHNEGKTDVLYGVPKKKIVKKNNKGILERTNLLHIHKEASIMRIKWRILDSMDGTERRTRISPSRLHRIFVDSENRPGEREEPERAPANI